MATASALAKGVGKEVTKLAVKTALGSLWKLLKYEWCLQDSVKKGLRRLEAELKMMQASIGDVSSGPQDQINSVDKLWLTEVEELSCTIVTGLQSFLSSIESTKDTLFSAASKLYINHKIDSFIQEKMTKAKELSERRGRYGFTSSQTTSAQEMGPRIHALFRKESDLVGLEEATKKLIQMLSKRDHVSIVGMGGMGKTTLARAVYGKLLMKENFDCCAFIPVGQHANVDKVLTDILEDLHIDIPYRNPEAWKLIKLLQASLEGKRCLFVFDDIWEDETWEMIKFAFVGTSEIRIITTTRNVEVAKPVDGAKPVEGVYFIEPLSDASSEMLLRTRLFITEAPDSEFFRLSNKILSKCGGVPIAIITIASLLATKKRVEWSEVYDSIGFGEPGKEDAFKNIMRILSYSYDDLPDHLQKCFLYLSLFPEGHWIEKNMLIWRWVAEGLVPGGSFQLGEKYFSKLIERSMIQRAVSPRDLGQGGCRVHKMMFDLIRRLSRSENKNFSTVIGTKRESTSQTSTIHRLAIHKTRVDESENTSTLPKKSPNTSPEVGEVLSFYASTCSGSSLPPLSKFIRLRVVDLQGCDLSDEDRKLKHLAKLRELAYVGLLGTPVAEKEIGLLVFLQTLDVTGTGIKELPLFVEKLKKLRCLRADKGTTMKGRVGELTSLEELWLHSADKSPEFAAELRKLTQLRLLVVHFDEIVEGMQEELVESLSILKKLQVLQVWFDTDRKVCLPCWEESMPFPKLRQLLLFGIIQSRMMPWIHCACVPELTKLLLEVEVLEEQDLEILGQMPSLLSLYLHSEDGNRLSYTASKDEFKVLEYLYTNIELVCGDGALPRIQELEVAGIRVGTDVGLRGNNMPLLERATYHLDCKDCGPEEVQKAEEALWQAIQGHPNRPIISIERWNDIGLEMRRLNEETRRRNDAKSAASSILGSPAFANVSWGATARAGRDTRMGSSSSQFPARQDGEGRVDPGNLANDGRESTLLLESNIPLWPSLEMTYQATEFKALEGVLVNVNAEPVKLSYPFIKCITRNFSQEIGRGGFGVVYLGDLGIGKVAVKKLSILQDFSGQFFLDEIQCLIMTKHNNIVRFLGYCAEMHGELDLFNGKHVLAEAPQRLLCFEYVPNGNLQKYLKGIQLATFPFILLQCYKKNFE